jgi:hypothetical protein
MTVAPEGDPRSLLYLVSLGAVVAATATAFFGTAYFFLWLASPNPTKIPSDLSPPAQALNTDEFSTSGDNETTGSTEWTADNVTTSSIPGASPLSNATITGAPSDREAAAASPRVMQATQRPIRPTEISHVKRSGSFGTTPKWPRGMRRYGALMPASDHIRAAAFTVLQTSTSSA